MLILLSIIFCDINLSAALISTLLINFQFWNLSRLCWHLKKHLLQAFFLSIYPLFYIFHKS